MKAYRLAYDKLRGAGLTHEAALAMESNWAKESLFDAFRKQGDLSEAAIPSHNYVAAVTSGAISRDQFARDQIGFGLAQWTFFDFKTGRGRKLNLYDFWRRSGQALDDPAMQVDFAIWELFHEYPFVYEKLVKSDNLYYCVDLICKKYEMPAFNNVDDRYKAALEIEAILAAEPESEPEPAPEPEADKPETPFWPPRVLCLGMVGSDVMLLQALLQAHGYSPGTCSGSFDNATEKALRHYQEKNFDLDGNRLIVDGVAGSKSFKSLGLNV